MFKANKHIYFVIIMNLLSFIGCKKIEVYDKSIKSIEKLLRSNPKNKGFIISSVKTEYEYVQYALEEYGFLFAVGSNTPPQAQLAPLRRLELVTLTKIW
jgi:hypothetical protein